MSLLSYKRCCCGTPACSPTWSPIGLTQDDLYFSWVSNADHGAGSIALSYYENANWKGWWGLLPCSPPSKAGITPTVVSGLDGACKNVCGGSNFNFLMVLACNDYSFGAHSIVSYTVPFGLNPATVCYLCPGAISLPSSNVPFLTHGIDRGSCPAPPISNIQRDVTFGATTTGPLSIACSFSTPLANSSGTPYPGYTFDYSGAITQ